MKECGKESFDFSVNLLQYYKLCLKTFIKTTAICCYTCVSNITFKDFELLSFDSLSMAAKTGSDNYLNLFVNIGLCQVCKVLSSSLIWLL